MFIYVTTPEARDKLLELQYTLLKSSDNLWVFENKDTECFENIDVPCVVSDILTF